MLPEATEVSSGDLGGSVTSCHGQASCSQCLQLTLGLWSLAMSSQRPPWGWGLASDASLQSGHQGSCPPPLPRILWEDWLGLDHNTRWVHIWEGSVVAQL